MSFQRPHSVCGAESSSFSIAIIGYSKCNRSASSPMDRQPEALRLGRGNPGIRDFPVRIEKYVWSRGVVRMPPSRPALVIRGLVSFAIASEARYNRTPAETASIAHLGRILHQHHRGESGPQDENRNLISRIPLRPAQQRAIHHKAPTTPRPNQPVSLPILRRYAKNRAPATRNKNRCIGSSLKTSFRGLNRTLKFGVNPSCEATIWPGSLGSTPRLRMRRLEIDWRTCLPVRSALLREARYFG